MNTPHTEWPQTSGQEINTTRVVNCMECMKAWADFWFVSGPRN